MIADTIVSVAAVLSALIAIGSVVYGIFKWFFNQKQQDEKIAELQKRHDGDMAKRNKEDAIICYALVACLDGLIQLGANHSVTEAKNKLNKHLNMQAHGDE